jgi:hypothetical protein
VILAPGAAPRTMHGSAEPVERSMIGILMGRRIRPAVEVPSGVTIRAGRWLPLLGGWLSGHARAAAAVTIGRTIVLHPEVRLTTRLLRHELAHVRQWRRRPFTFPVHYAWLHLRHGYSANPYEVEARAAERMES